MEHIGLFFKEPQSNISINPMPVKFIRDETSSYVFQGVRTEPNMWNKTQLFSLR